MKYLLIFLQLTLSIPIALCQEHKQLIIEDNVKGKSREFEENQRIKIWANDKMYKGKFNIENDSTIAIGGESIAISGITQFKGRTKKSLITGSLLAGVPPLFTGVTIILGFQTSDLGYLMLATGGFFVGVVTIPIGITLITSTKKACGIDNRYSLSIE